MSSNEVEASYQTFVVNADEGIARNGLVLTVNDTGNTTLDLGGLLSCLELQYIRIVSNGNLKRVVLPYKNTLTCYISAPAIGEIDGLLKYEVGGIIDHMLNERLLGVLSTKEDVNLETLGFEVSESNKYQAIVTPIDIAGERLGTLFIYKVKEQYTIDDIILCEYGSTVVGLEMLRAVNEESAEENRKLQVVKSAIGTLSFSEMEAIIHIFDELDGNEGILVASKIADRVGITRSVIVNALRKFESAGVIESRSSGMKGTYIKVLNPVIFDEIEELKRKK